MVVVTPHNQATKLSQNPDGTVIPLVSTSEEPGKARLTQKNDVRSTGKSAALSFSRTSPANIRARYTARLKAGSQPEGPAKGLGAGSYDRLLQATNDTHGVVVKTTGVGTAVAASLMQMTKQNTIPVNTVENIRVGTTPKDVRIASFKADLHEQQHVVYVIGPRCMRGNEQKMSFHPVDPETIYQQLSIASSNGVPSVQYEARSIVREDNSKTKDGTEQVTGPASTVVQNSRKGIRPKPSAEAVRDSHAAQQVPYPTSSKTSQHELCLPASDPRNVQRATAHSAIPQVPERVSFSATLTAKLVDDSYTHRLHQATATINSTMFQSRIHHMGRPSVSRDRSPNQEHGVSPTVPSIFGRTMISF